MTYREQFAKDYVKDNRLKLADGLVTGKCKWCGCLFVKEHNKELYCSDECRDYARNEQSRMKSYRWYHNHKHELSEEQRWGLGSGYLGGHRHNDFNKEYEIICNEFVRLRLKR